MTTKPEDALVEKVARAMCGYDLEWRDCERACLAAGKCAGKMNEHQLAEARAAIEASGITTLLERERRLRGALRTMVYETTHLSPCREDGSHNCIISEQALSEARAALTGMDK